MSGGQLEHLGQVAGWDDIKSYLLESDVPTTLTNDYEEDWSSTNWGWGSEDQENLDKTNAGISTTDSTSEKKHISWLDECIIANSPTGDVLVIAKGPRAIFLTSECDIDTNRIKYSEGFKGKLSEEDGEFITSIACLPLISQKRSSPGAPDWTCIFVGFSRGYVRIYTETGMQLVSQQLHNERVLSFKVRSFVPSRISLQHDQLEELVVVYRTVVATMDGFGVFQTLRAYRSHLARLKANAAESTIDPPYLEHKKWSYENEQTVSDCEMIGLNTPCAFDHLFTASLLGGFNAKPNPNPPTASVFSSVGQKPFLAFHHAQESQAPPILSEVAYAVASKVKSSILNAATGWLGLSSSAAKPSVKETRSLETPIPMSFRTGLSDIRRNGTSITCSPGRNLSVVTDSLGRVMLIDNTIGITVRMWKGYRDAQCSWIQVDEQLSTSSKAKGREGRTALFLVIYAPRRERLEVFAMQQGPKVASFEVNKHGRLLSTSFGMMGLNNVHIKGGNKPVTQSLFVDSTGNIFTFLIPFHLALCDKGSSKVKDLHLLKALQKLLREGQYTETNISEILVEVRTQSMINQGFRILTQKCSKVDVLAEVLQAYSQKFCDSEEKDLSVVFRIISLLELYESLVSSDVCPPAYVSVEDHDSKDNKSLLYCLHASEKEMLFLEKMAKDELECKSPKSKSVTFESDSSAWSLNEFFACFAIEFDPNKIKASNTAVVHSSVVAVNFKSDGMDKLAELLFSGCLNGTTDLEDWKQKLSSAGLNAGTILLLAFQYWCQNSLQSSSYVVVMEKLYYVVKTLCDLEGYTAVISDFNQVSKWWEEIRKEITSSSHVFPIYSFSIACRAVAIDLQHQGPTENSPSKAEMMPADTIHANTDASDTEASHEQVEGPSAMAIDSGFENISLDLLKWNILLKQIEDLSLLSSILVQRPQLERPQLPLLKGQLDSLTVIKLLDKGKGCIAELVGKWLTTIGIDPQLITDSIEDEVSVTVSATTRPADGKEEGKVDKTSVHIDEVENGEEAVEAEKSTNHVLDLLRCLRGNFSVSLSSSIILSNYCWEYCLEWKNETNNVEYLGAAIKCSSAIPSPLIRQGMVSMIWNIFVSKKLLAVAAISKTTREKLADRTGGFSSHEKKLEFLNYSVQFLDLFMETNIVCDGSPPPPNPTPKNHWSSEVNSNASLTDLALLQPLPNFEMILLHYQLALCAQLFYTFRIKGTMKPTNLFDTKSRMLLSQSMQNPAPFSHTEVDFALKTLREEFLCLSMSGAVRAIPDEPATSSSTQSEHQRVVPSDVGVKECESWINKCMELGRIWRLELDGLRISYVCELYSSGLDNLGLEAISAVQGRDILGTKLLLISGMRLSYVINQRRDNVTEIISSFSTNLSKWLDSLEYSALRSLRFSKASIPELLTQVLQLIQEANYDYKLAKELLSASSCV